MDPAAAGTNAPSSSHPEPSSSTEGPRLHNGPSSSNPQPPSPTEGPLLQIVYISHTPEADPSASSIASILGVSRRNNERSGITGLIIYSDTSFLQFLEGPHAAVEALFSKIKHDARHRGVIVVLRLAVEQRSFPDWSMAYRDLYIAEAAINEERQHAISKGDDPELINVDRAARHGLLRVLANEPPHE